MRLLQEEYGIKLYERTARGVELTNAGSDFLAAISPILEQVRKLKANAAPTAVPNDPERLGLGGTYSVSTNLLPSLLSRFKKSNPMMEIDFRTNNATEIERLLLKHSIEIALTTRPPKSPQIAVEPFRRERLVFFVSRRHPLAGAGEISLRDIERTPLLVRTSAGRDGTTISRLKDQIERQGVKVTIGMRFESPNAMMEAVQRNMGIGVVYEDNLDRDEFKVLKVRGLNLEGQSHILYLKDKSLSKPAVEFLMLLRSSRPDKSKTKPQFPAADHFSPAVAIGTSLPFAALCRSPKHDKPSLYNGRSGVRSTRLNAFEVGIKRVLHYLHRYLHPSLHGLS